MNNKYIFNQDTSFEVGQHIFIKKYHGEKLKPDTSRKFEIVSIRNAIHTGTSTVFVKNCILNNGKEQAIYTYDMINKQRTFYIEPAYSIYNFCCCFS
tara:strand:+ start:2232 stop:2522 length:291 start_codon:yes stop_codon:yes gene_type:complete